MVLIADSEEKLQILVTNVHDQCRMKDLKKSKQN